MMMMMMMMMMMIIHFISREQGLSSSYYGWAFHSESEEELLAMVPPMLRGEPTWAELRQFGVGWWVRSDDTLRRLIEKVGFFSWCIGATSP